MKNNLSFLLCLVLFSCGQTQIKNDGNTRDTASAPSMADSIKVTRTPASVEEIKQLYADLNYKLQSAKLDSTSIKYDCNGERTGTVTYFYENGKLCVIKHNYSEYSHFSAVEQYFVSDDKLFFAHLTSLNWSFESEKGVTGATKDIITEKRFYVVKEKALLCLEKSYVKKSHSSEYPRPESIENKQVDCKSLEPLLKDFGKLLSFKNSSSQGCLEK